MHRSSWRLGEVEKFTNTPLWQLSLARGMAMDVEQAAVETSEAAEDALKSLKVAMDKFKSTLANDLTSIKAAGSRVQSEALQMKQAYQAAQAMLTNAEFERAVANAERMAAALKAISELSETKLSVAVFSGGHAREG
jgi:two-component SAPR family response regulator